MRIPIAAAAFGYVEFKVNRVSGCLTHSIDGDLGKQGPAEIGMHDSAGQIEDGAGSPAAALDQLSFNFHGQGRFAEIRGGALTNRPPQLGLNDANRLAHRQSPPITDQWLYIGVTQ